MYSFEPEKREPVYWFVLLERPVHRGDHAEAAHAHRELMHMGVDVRYGLPAKARPREASHAG